MLTRISIWLMDRGVFCFLKWEPFTPLLWMNEILHHLRSFGMMIPQRSYQRTMVSNGFKVVQDFVHPQYQQCNRICFLVVGYPRSRTSVRVGKPPSCEFPPKPNQYKVRLHVAPFHAPTKGTPKRVEQLVFPPASLKQFNQGSLQGLGYEQGYHQRRPPYGVSPDTHGATPRPTNQTKTTKPQRPPLNPEHALILRRTNMAAYFNSDSSNLSTKWSPRKIRSLSQGGWGEGRGRAQSPNKP